MMKWFNENGDKLLAGAGVVLTGLAQAGIATPYIGPAIGILGMLHTLFWPNNSQTPPGK